MHHNVSKAWLFYNGNHATRRTIPAVRKVGPFTIYASKFSRPVKVWHLHTRYMEVTR
jgi:hypothetical protein